MTYRTKIPIDELAVTGMQLLSRDVDPFIDLQVDHNDYNGETVFDLMPTYIGKKQQLVDWMLRASGCENTNNATKAVTSGLRQTTYPNNRVVERAMRTGQSFRYDEIQYDTKQLLRVIRYSGSWSVVRANVPVYGEQDSRIAVMNAIPESSPRDFLNILRELNLPIDEIVAAKSLREHVPLDSPELLAAKRRLGRAAPVDRKARIDSYLSYVREHHREWAMFDIQEYYRQSMFRGFPVRDGDPDESHDFRHIAYIPIDTVPRSIPTTKPNYHSTISLSEPVIHDADLDGSRRLVRFYTPAVPHRVRPILSWMIDSAGNRTFFYGKYRVEHDAFRDEVVHTSPGLGLLALAYVALGEEGIDKQIRELTGEFGKSKNAYAPGLGLLALSQLGINMGEHIKDTKGAEYVGSLEQYASDLMGIRAR